MRPGGLGADVTEFTVKISVSALSYQVKIDKKSTVLWFDEGIEALGLIVTKTLDLNLLSVWNALMLIPFGLDQHV